MDLNKAKYVQTQNIKKYTEHILFWNDKTRYSSRNSFLPVIRWMALMSINRSIDRQFSLSGSKLYLHTVGGNREQPSYIRLAQLSSLSSLSDAALVWSPRLMILSVVTRSDIRVFSPEYSSHSTTAEKSVFKVWDVWNNAEVVGSSLCTSTMELAK